MLKRTAAVPSMLLSVPGAAQFIYNFIPRILVANSGGYSADRDLARTSTTIRLMPGMGSLDPQPRRAAHERSDELERRCADSRGAMENEGR
jgi:hypothetical protein